MMFTEPERLALIKLLEKEVTGPAWSRNNVYEAILEKVVNQPPMKK